MQRQAPLDGAGGQPSAAPDACAAVPGRAFRRARDATGTAKAPGFTLVELMITLAVAAILLMIAVPSFKHIMGETNLSGISNDLAGALQYARTEAASRQTNVAVAASSGGWQDGWTVQIPPAGTAGGAPDVLRRHSAVATQYVVNAGTATDVTFQPQGSPLVATGTCFTIAAASGEHNPPRFLQVLPAGMLQQTTGGSPPTAPNCPPAP